MISPPLGHWQAELVGQRSDTGATVYVHVLVQVLTSQKVFAELRAPLTGEQRSWIGSVLPNGQIHLSSGNGSPWPDTIRAELTVRGNKPQLGLVTGGTGIAPFAASGPVSACA